MNIENICVLGGSGVVGRHICEALAARGYRLRVPTRRRERVKHLTVLPTVEVIEANIHDPQTLAWCLRGQQAVINLVGVLHGGRGSSGFKQAHVELARKVVDACRQQGVQRLLHMSALNADAQGPSDYLRSKGAAEVIVRDSGLAYTIFRPSVIFGPGDRFLSVFACMQSMLPVVVLACPNARFQPVYVEDVAAAFAEALEDPDSVRAAYDLCGPKVYTLRQLMRYAGEVSGHPRPVLGLGSGLSNLQAAVLEFLPGKLMSRDNVRSMTVDSVCTSQFPFGIRPTALESVAPNWLAPQSPRTRFQPFRIRARR
jgi:NADH dehydrogenase